jgi:hypothetical protein
MARQQKITFGEMRRMGVRGLLIYCSDYKCSHSTAISGDPWPDEVRLSDIELVFTCKGMRQRVPTSAPISAGTRAGRRDE